MQTLPTSALTRSALKKRAIRGDIVAACFLLPFTILYTVFTIYPVLQGGYISFFKWNLMGKQGYVGFANYQTIFGDSFFWLALWNTTKFVLYSTPVIMLIGCSVMVGQRENRRFLFLRICADADRSRKDHAFIFKVAASYVRGHFRGKPVNAIACVRVSANQVQLFADFAAMHIELSILIGMVDRNGIGTPFILKAQDAGFMARKDFFNLFARGKSVNRAVFALFGGGLSGGRFPFNISLRPFPFVRNRQAFKASQILAVVRKQKRVLTGEHFALDFNDLVGFGNDGRTGSNFANSDHDIPPSNGFSAIPL